MKRENVYEMVKLAKENLIDKFEVRYNDVPSIDDLTWGIDQPITNLYHWVELVTLRAGLVYAGNVGEWSIPSTKYVMETIEKIVTRRVRRME